MNKPHKWAKEIKAWADGATIQVRLVSPTSQTSWDDIPPPKWGSDNDVEYRIKPEPREWTVFISKTTGGAFIHTGNQADLVDFSKIEKIKVREVLE